MSDTQCRDGDTTGFPVTLAQSLYTNWPATQNAQAKLQKLIVPTDFSIQWQNNGKQTCNISVQRKLNSATGPGFFQVSGFNPEGCTITYGPAIYQCSGVISIVQNQHPNLTQGSNAQYEMILAFQIRNKNINPSSPDIILLCRPLIFQTSGSNTPFWDAVDTATTQEKLQNNVSVDLSSFYGYNASLPMPMITYQTCLPVKRFDGTQHFYGSLRMRVNVVPQPIYLVASETGLGKCSTINKYTLITSGNGPIEVFGRGSIIQFRDGTTSDLFPAQTSRSNLVPNNAPNPISAFADVLQKFEILVPEAFLGKSLSDIANTQTPPPVKNKKKAYKCYTIDPSRDIVGDQIMVDPTTGQSLLDTQKQEAIDAAGGDTSNVQTTYYTISGDDITGSVRVKKTFIDPNVTNNMIFIAQDGELIRVVITPSSDQSNIIDSANFKGDISKISSAEDFFKLTREATDRVSDRGKVRVNVITVNSLANDASSGILPGDIEHILTIIATAIGTISLLAYLGFIVHMVLYRENGFHTSLPHMLGFIVCLVGLVLFGIYVEKPTE